MAVACCWVSETAVDVSGDAIAAFVAAMLLRPSMACGLNAFLSNMTTPSYRRRGDQGEQAPPPPPIRVLVVDDDDNFRAYLGALLRRQGCVVQMAADGEEGWTRVCGGELDLLLSDLEMPRLNGLGLIERVRAAKATAGIYAVMMTSHGDLQTKLDALSRGFDDFLPKRCEELEVVAKVSATRRMLSRQRVLDSEVREWRALASCDELTNVATRRAFFEQAHQYLAEGRTIGVALFDLDHFKEINDTYGHPAGDTILRDAGSRLLEITRHDDLMARYGGDEFVLLMDNLSLEQSLAVAARVETEIGKLQWNLGGQQVRISTTAGVAHSVLLADPTIEQLLEAADRDLYARKFVRRHPSSAPDAAYQYPEQAAVVVPLRPAGENDETEGREDSRSTT